MTLKRGDILVDDALLDARFTPRRPLRMQVTAVRCGMVYWRCYRFALSLPTYCTPIAEAKRRFRRRTVAEYAQDTIGGE